MSKFDHVWKRRNFWNALFPIGFTMIWWFRNRSQLLLVATNDVSFYGAGPLRRMGERYQETNAAKRQLATHSPNKSAQKIDGAFAQCLATNCSSDTSTTNMRSPI